MAQPSAGTGSSPSQGGNIDSAPLRTRLDNLYAFLNEASNIDEANADLSGTDGLVGKSTAQTITGQKTFDATVVLTGTYLKPLLIATIRVWADTTNGYIRAKVGSDPSTEIDGNIIMWGV